MALLERGLAFEGFDVVTAGSGPAGLEAVENQHPNVILLDIAMPGQDGFDVCRQMRLRDDVPIIMLTARDDVSDKVAALNLGADDYVAKPFAFDELVARIRAVLRRHQSSFEPIHYSDLVMDPSTREVWRTDGPIELTAREFDVLLYFVRHPRQVITREQLLEHVWGYEVQPDTNAVEVHVGHVRQKLEAAGGARLIQTIRGIGYALRD